jgi:hypothetical protein
MLAREPLPPYGTISTCRASGHFTSPHSAAHAPAARVTEAADHLLSRRNQRDR